MSLINLPKYQFLPWLREGLGNTITDIDTLAQGGTVGGRAKLSLQVNINTQQARTKEFMIVGPADVIGFSKDLVIRTEPVHWSTTFASNLLAHIEFYEEDFPWRYSPARADVLRPGENISSLFPPRRSCCDKLRPWISLIVLKEDEFRRNETVVPLTQIELTNKAILPDFHETWLWAHVQKIESSTLPSDKTIADHIISRLICPRKLEANTRYYAFVIPTFESGRLAGLGKSEADIKKVRSQDPAWGLTSPPLPAFPQTIFPVYYEWFFRTADEMDFEYLASLLEAKLIDPLVGKKPIDCSKPGFGIPDYREEFTLYMEGALRAPQSMGSVSISNESAANLVDFETRISQLLNLTNQGAGDPVVTPPFYGQKHIFEKTLLLDGKYLFRWDEIPGNDNGKLVEFLRQKYDIYWVKTAKIEKIEGGRTINVSTEKNSLSLRLNDEETKVNLKIDDGRIFELNARMEKSKLNIYDKKTWIHQLNRNPAYRAVSGLGTKVFRKYQDLYLHKAWEQLESIVEANKIIDSANTSLAICQLLYEKNIFKLPFEEMISFAGPVHVKEKVKSANGTISTLFQAFRMSCFNGSVYSGAFRRLTSRRGSFRRKLEQNGSRLDLDILKKVLIERTLSPFTLLTDNYSILVINRPTDFTFHHYFDDRRPLDESQDFDHAFNSFAAMLKNPPAKEPCEKDIHHSLLENINPSLTITRLLSKTLNMPEEGWFNDPLKIKAALAYPDFEDPMVEKLKELSLEWLAPNLHLIPNNSVTIMEPNRKFIEAFMVGVNVAMNQEMRWREYPTDERGSCFRQFWDVKGIKNVYDPAANLAKIVEQFKDISPIHTWKNWNHEIVKEYLDEFGKHNTRSKLQEDQQLVLVIRGDLLKCFPNTTIYAAKAKSDGTPQNKLIINAGATPEFPVFKVEAGADLKFIGFDLTVAEAKGDDPANPAGWFFVLQETPGEVRFGLNISGPVLPPTSPEQKFTWDNASWDLVSGKKISKTETKVTTFEQYLDSTEKNADGSLKRKWGRTSADMAYILYQKPVMIAIHAREMLS